MSQFGCNQHEEHERTEQTKRLLKTVGESHFDDHMYRHYFAEQLAGFTVDFAQDGNKFKLHQNVADASRDKAIRDRRLASPDHYRLYFALSGPSHALTQANLDDLWLASDTGQQQTGELILKWHAEMSGGSLGRADILLERMRDFSPEILNAQRSRSFLVAFSNVLDEAYRLRPFDLHWFNALWERAERLVPILLSRLETEDRSVTLKTMFAEGTAIAWLTRLFRSDTFSQGRFGDQKKQEVEWLFTTGELATITNAMLARYQIMSVKDVMETIDPVDLLYAWKQGGDEEGPTKLIADASQTDEGFIETLEKLSKVITSRDLPSFLNFEVARDRTVRLANAADSNPLVGRAANLENLFGWSPQS
jgi:hypothetical protein